MQSKFIKWAIIIVAFLFSFFIIYNQNKAIDNLNSEIAVKSSVIKSYEYENTLLTEQTIVQNRTISELNFSNDSINNKLIEKIKELKIKENRIKELEYIQQKSSRIDSIFIKDTIFIKDFHIDTTIADKWYKLQVKMKYPNLIIINPEFTSELEIIKYRELEYVDYPKKCWLGRLLQKKILVERVEVIENNPYVKTIKYRDIEIIDK